MENNNHICIICKETEDEEPGLKLFIPERWETAKKAAECRITLGNDHFFDISEEIKTVQPEDKNSHKSFLCC